MFLNPVNEAFHEHSHYQQVSINLQENMLKSMLVSFFASSIRKTIPEEQWGRYLISSQNMECVQSPLHGYLTLTTLQLRQRRHGNDQQAHCLRISH